MNTTFDETQQVGSPREELPRGETLREETQQEQDYRREAVALKEANDKLTADLAQAKTSFLQQMTRRMIGEAGFRESLLPLIEGCVEVRVNDEEGGDFANWLDSACRAIDAKLQELAKKCPEALGETGFLPSKVRSPLSGGYSVDISSMSEGEINRNWDTVREELGRRSN